MSYHCTYLAMVKIMNYAGMYTTFDSHYIVVAKIIALFYFYRHHGDIVMELV